MGRAPCCDKANVKKGPWSPEEDATLKSYIEKNGTGGNWIALPQKIGLKRCGKSCRLRWLNYLRPNIKHGGFSEEEDNIICSLYISIGSRWSIIAAQLPGRTDNDIKNYWNTRLKKKLLGAKLRKNQHKEAKEEENGSNVVVSTNTYWPDHQPNNVPMYPINQAEHRVNDEYSSIRRLLMRLGGRFANDDSIVVPPQQVFDASANLMAPNSVQTSSFGFNPTDLDDLFGCNSVKLEGLDCFYGTNGTSISEDHANWSEVSPLIYNNQPMIENFQTMPPCLFEEQVHLGTQ